MTLLKCTIRRILFAITIFMLTGNFLSAKGKLSLVGQVFDENGEREQNFMNIFNRYFNGEGDKIEKMTKK